jgi:hypothetical protein
MSDGIEHLDFPARNTYWLSFADESGNLGGCFVRANSPLEAVERAHELGINPGGEVMILGPGPEATMEYDRLFQKDEVADAISITSEGDES